MLKRFKKNRKGFSLIELMIVVAILGIIATIAIPILLTARNAAIAEKAHSSLRTVSSAEAAYYSREGQYADFATLEAGGYIDGRFTAGDLGEGITVALTVDPQSFTCTVTCPDGTTYSIDESGQIT